jgi:PST family polysaccharide transporter
MAVGVILGILTVAIAPILVYFYHEPRLFWVTVALGTGFVFNAVSQQHQALLQRQMRFVELSVIEILTWVVGIAVGIAMAVGGLGYWALVGMAVIMPVVGAVAVWIVTSWIPGRPCRGVGIRSMLRFGGAVTLNSLVVYLGYNAEKVLSPFARRRPRGIWKG